MAQPFYPMNQPGREEALRYKNEKVGYDARDD